MTVFTKSNCPSCKGWKRMIMPDGKEYDCDMCKGSGESK